MSKDLAPLVHNRSNAAKLKRLRTYLSTPLHIAPLASFRVIFGAVMLFSILRFMWNGWVTEMYVEPEFFFTYYGFEWVQPLGATGMHLVFAGMAVAAGLIMLGLFYRIAAPAFFLLFTYVELLDKTNYLNHYYFVSIIAFLLILVPAQRYFSLDVLRNPGLKRSHVPRWCVGIFRLQLGMVYFFAGLAKVNADWLLRAMPLKIWLPANYHLPLIGGLLKFKWVAYAFSWFGCLYDLLIPFFLVQKKTRRFAYIAVIAFHLMTWWLFPIGMFPFIMIGATLIYFPAETHRKVLEKIASWGPKKTAKTSGQPTASKSFSGSKLVMGLIVAHFVVQAVLPFRYLLYPGELFWTEQGYRFSWRVMLMEKAGHATFHVYDPATGRKGEVDNARYLTPNQEKMMATQPDMILSYAHFLAEEYKQQGIPTPEIRGEIYVTLNGSGTRPFIDETVNLAEIKEGFKHKTWILPFAQGS